MSNGLDPDPDLGPNCLQRLSADNKSRCYSKERIEKSNILCDNLQSKLFIMSLFITEYSISDINCQGTDLFPLNFSLYNRSFTK